MPKYDSPPFTADYALGIHYPGANAGPGPRDGPVDGERPTSPAVMYNPFFTGRPRTPTAEPARPAHMDRQEIIKRIKHCDPQRPHTPVQDAATKTKSRSPTPLLPSPGTPQPQPAAQVGLEHHASVGLDISRPKSALHSGDFREQQQTPSWTYDGQTRDQRLPPRDWTTAVSTSPVAPWHHEFPAAALRQPMNDIRTPAPATRTLPTRPRAISHASLSGGFTYQPPTSPLVHQANAADIPDHPTHLSRRSLQSPDRSGRSGRRHTYSPRELQSSRSALQYASSARPPLSPHAPSLRKEATFPYQAHQPRRLSQSFQSLPQTPYPGARRPSVSDGSPLQHAPMVGSYEESILRGRMSTTPSKPLNFVAQIGVLGKGDCKPSLKCPPHIVVPFPAVFYSYSSGLTAEPEPSPYVGMIDLENSLNKTNERDGSRRRRRVTESHGEIASRPQSLTRSGDEDVSDARARRRKQQKLKRRTVSPRDIPGGCYRIPQHGQLQIVIKNPNKTAVKLFLVPYDLSDMQPGQKTFIRQRSYSAGPVIDMPLGSRKNLGTDRPEASLSATSDPRDRPILRYLIHLHICCSSKGRFYLYQNIRVVFANRVPDGKEKLRSEIQMPEPRYTVFKPGRDSNVALPTAKEDQRSRRRSEIYQTIHSGESMSSMQSQPSDILSASVGSTPHLGHYNQPLFVQSVDSYPYNFSHLERLPTLESRPASRGLSDTMDLDSTVTTDDKTSPISPLSPTNNSWRVKNLSPRRRGDSQHSVPEPLTFSREQSRERAAGTRTESLLSRRLKSLEMRGQDKS
ncbi:hypothetical protein MBLNU459_g0875t1 [Dothideomycetes sp. NU459]